MEMPFGLYPRFYVKRKDQLFPLIEKYSGEAVKDGETHGKTIQRYFALLRDDPAFREEVDNLISAQGGKLATAKEKQVLKRAQINMNEGERLMKGNNYQNGKVHNSASGAAMDPVTAIASGIGSIFDFANTRSEANAEADAQFMEIVLNEQKKNDTGKILVITGITLAFVGLGVYLVLKLKK